MRKFILFLIIASYGIVCHAADFYDTQIKGNPIRIDVKNGREYKPAVTMTVFNGENYLKIIRDKMYTGHGIDDNKVVLSSTDGNEAMQMYTDGDNFKVIFYFSEKPEKLEARCTLEGWEEYDFFYQSIWENVKVIVEDDKRYVIKQDEPKAGGKRLEEVQGSYAVYHKTKRNHVRGETNYGTGKAFHIYRPKFVDANGKSAYAEIFRIKDGEYYVKAPDTFRDEATYPVRTNDTIGYTGVGESEYDSWDVIGCNASASSSGDVDTIHFYMEENGWSGNIVQGFYTDSGGSPATHQAHTSSSAGSAGWNAFSSSGTITSGNSYFILCQQDRGTTRFGEFEDEVEGIEQVFEESETYNNWPDSPSWQQYSNYRVSIYITYTSAGEPAGGGEMPHIYIFE